MYCKLAIDKSGTNSLKTGGVQSQHDPGHGKLATRITGNGAHRITGNGNWTLFTA